MLPEVHTPTSLHRFAAGAIAGGSLIAWLASIAVATVDAVRAHFPTGFTVLTVGVAMTGTVVAAVMSNRFAMLARVESVNAQFGELAVALGRYAALLEQQRETRSHGTGRRRVRAARRPASRQRPAEFSEEEWRTFLTGAFEQQRHQENPD